MKNRNKTEIEKVYSLSPMQEGMLFHFLKDKKSSAYFEQFVFSIKGDIDRELLEKSFNLIIEKYDTLRTVFVYKKMEKLKQVVLKNVLIEIPFEDISHLSEAERDHYLETFKREDREKGFDLTRDRLMRLALFKTGEGIYRLAWSFHHIIMDGWCSGIIFKDLMEIYRALRKGEPLSLQPVTPYKAYIEWLAEQDREEGLNYWKHYLEGYEQGAGIPRFRKAGPDAPYRLGRYNFHLDAAVSRGLINTARDRQVTVNTVFQALWGIFLHRYANAGDVVFGAVVSGRPAEINGIERMVGLFVNTIPVRVRVDGEENFTGILREVHRQSTLSKAYEYLPLAEIQANSPLKRELLDHIIAFENYPIEKEIKDPDHLQRYGFAIEDIQAYEQTNYDFDIIVVPGDEFLVRFNFNSSVHHGDYIRSTALNFSETIKQVLQHPTADVDEIDVISGEERKHLLETFNNTDAPYPAEQTLHGLISQQAVQNPGKVAVVFQEESFTYEQLEKRANQLARYLQDEKGLEPDRPVGILMDRCIHLMTAVLGVLKAGGAYVPLDPLSPEDRIKTVLTDAGITVVLSLEQHIRTLNRLQWECPLFHTFLCMDSTDIYSEEEKEKSGLMDETLWYHVGKEAGDEITGGGWQSSYTGQPFSKEEMDEYGDNILKKLTPLLTPSMRVLEIGCASGITMFRIAPKVGFYYGTDLSDIIIRKDRERVEKEGWQNITLACLPAHEIDKIEERNFDLVIMNSVIHCFHGHNYLRRVIGKAIDLLGDTGYLFIGDVLNQDLKAAITGEMKAFKRNPANKGKNYRTKTDWSTELFVSPLFFEDLEVSIPGIQSAAFSGKIHTIENELTKFRYDTLIRVDKTRQAPVNIKTKRKKYQEDSRMLDTRGDGPLDSRVGPANLAYIIYTSGSTGRPKGAMVEHRSVVNRLHWMQEAYPIGQQDVILQKTPFIFDVSVWELFWWAIEGASVCFLGPGDEKDPGAIVKAIEKNRITTMHFVPSMLTVFLEYVEGNNELQKVSSLRRVFASGEALGLSQVETFNKLLFQTNGTKLVNLYGPTEATVDVSYFNCSTGEPLERVPIGKPIANIRLYIVNEKLKMQPVGVPGELCISGIGLARGYLNRPQLTTERFAAFHRTYRTYRTYIAYRTGDLARWLPDGNIEFLGRIDQQVKIRGYRIEPEEIQDRLLTHEHIKQAVVTARSDSRGNNYLCAYLVSDRVFNVSELREYLSGHLPEYMIPERFVEIEEIPVTRTGKINRKALPDPDKSIGTGGTYVAPRNEIEEKLVTIWRAVLETDKISVTDNFFELGGNSIKAIRIISEINKEFLFEISLNDFMDPGTVAAAAAHIAGSKAAEPITAYPQITPGFSQLHEPFPLTDVQMAYLMGRSDRFEMGGISTHVYKDVNIDLDIQRLNHALNKVIRRHPMMRAIVLEDGQQQVLEVEGYQIKVEDLTGLNTARQKERILKERQRMSHYIFKTDQWPLFELKAFKLPDGTHHLCIGLDILIADAASIGIISRELMAFYQDPDLELPPLEISFRDYMLAYREFKQSGTYQKDKDYWLGRLADFPPAPALPLKCSPSEIKNPRFKRHRKVFSKPEWTQLKDMAQKKAVTPSALLCTAYAEVLAFWSNQPRLAVNLTVFNRYPFHEDIDKIVGDFTSVILLGIQLEPGSTFWQNAGSVQAALWEALEHRHYDGVAFIRDIAKHNQSVNRAMMPVVFTSTLFGKVEEAFGDEFGREQDPAEESDKLSGTSITQTSQVFLDFQADEENEQLVLRWDYVEALFEDRVIDSMFHQFVNLIARLIQEKGDANFKYALQPPPQEQLLIEQYNQTREEIQPAALHQLFTRQAKITPDHIAVEYGAEKITYEQLDKMSNRAAYYLREQGMGPGDFIGLSAPRSIDTIINVTAIVKSGAAYVPIEPEYPEERRTYIYNNSECKLLMEPGMYREKHMARYPHSPLENRNRLDDLAYIIYTSGSTGEPKGVQITHRAVGNTIIDINRKFDVNHRDRVMGISSMCFDLSVYDVFGTLSSGAALVLIKDQRDAKLLANTVQKHKITLWNSVPALMDMTIKQMDREQDPLQKEKTGPEEIYYWSPSIPWSRKGSQVKIGKSFYPGVALELFPRFYFLCQEGISINQLMEQFPTMEPGQLKDFIWDLIRNRVLVRSVLTVEEILQPQERLFKNTYGEEILVDNDKFEAFKQHQLKRSLKSDHKPGILLHQDREFPLFIRNRRTYREFDRERKITFKVFSRLLSIFKQYEEDGITRYYYASAGALYPIDVYVYVKGDRVENIDRGLYYYHPVDNTLNLVDTREAVTAEAHSPGNQPIFQSSAFSIFMIYNADVSMPKYGGLAFQFAGIDTGIMVGTLTQAAELLGVGLCSIGSMNFAKISGNFKLNENQVFMHAVEVGLAADKAETPYEDLFTEANEVTRIPVEKTAAKPGRVENNTLRLVLLSGDWIPLKLPEKIKEYFPKAGIISLGGATEASIWSIYYPIREIEAEWKSIPYGRPLANQRFYVLNYALQPCPVGVPGELYIGGVGLAAGYFKDEQKTKHAFIKHPQLGNLYKTGDYGVFHGQGYIEFLGRRDLQVKIRGHRIELGEIENQLMQHEDIKEAIVTVREDKKAERYLCAYFIPAAGNGITSAALREYLAKKVPVYMVPSFFIPIDTIPLTANRKVDRKSLPDPEQVYADMSLTFVPPETDIEKRISRICREVTALDSIGVEDNFFELGINSLDIARINRELKAEFKVDIPIVSMFEYSTIRTFSQYMSRELLVDRSFIDDIDAAANRPAAAAQSRNRFRQRIEKRRGLQDG